MCFYCSNICVLFIFNLNMCWICCSTLHVIWNAPCLTFHCSWCASLSPSDSMRISRSNASGRRLPASCPHLDHCIGFLFVCLFNLMLLLFCLLPVQIVLHVYQIKMHITSNKDLLIFLDLLRLDEFTQGFIIYLKWSKMCLAFMTML